jgi:hypothetical protein
VKNGGIGGGDGINDPVIVMTGLNTKMKMRGQKICPPYETAFSEMSG